MPKLAASHGIRLIRAHIHMAHLPLSPTLSCSHKDTQQPRNHLGFHISEYASIHQWWVSSQSLINSLLIILLHRPNHLQSRLYELNSS